MLEKTSLEQNQQERKSSEILSRETIIKFQNQIITKLHQLGLTDSSLELSRSRNFWRSSNQSKKQGTRNFRVQEYSIESNYWLTKPTLPAVVQQSPSNHSLLTCLARIFLPLGEDPCASIILQHLRLLWSSNHSEQFTKVMETVEIFSDLLSSDHQKSTIAARKLLEEALSKDAKLAKRLNVEITYEECLKGADNKAWKEFTRFFQQQQEITNLNKSEEEKRAIITSFFNHHQDLVRTLLQVKSQQEDNQLPYRLYQPLLNLTDLLIILEQKIARTEWWKSIMNVFEQYALQQVENREKKTTTKPTAFQIIKPELNKVHAEMKMLEEVAENWNWYLQESSSQQAVNRHQIIQQKERVRSLLNSEGRFATTKKFCLSCQIVMLAIERTVQTKETNPPIAEGTSQPSKQNLWKSILQKQKSRLVSIINKGKSKAITYNGSSGYYFKGWNSPCIHNKQFKEEVQDCCETVFKEVLQEITAEKDTKREETWIEQHLVSNYLDQ